eukprot:TRINITY_DN2968_c0_g1_i1.p1 TRINITY_DN2968_c0_g1~~TRINITY_DN2968_c0_g1_i1.p1  ORF type:complete len:278 (-),score=74.17 TRINITY_DN2968_c0_g1_i1:21-854(-)
MELLTRVLLVADGLPGVTSVACNVLCARKNFTTVSCMEEAPRVMLFAMLRAALSFRGKNLRRLKIYMRENKDNIKCLKDALSFISGSGGFRLYAEEKLTTVTFGGFGDWAKEKEFGLFWEEIRKMEGLPYNPQYCWFTDKMIWIDRDFSSKTKTNLFDKFAGAITIIPIKSDSPQTEYQAFRRIFEEQVGLVVTNVKRYSNDTGIQLITKLRLVGYGGIIVCYGKSMEKSSDGLYSVPKMQALQAGANLATFDLTLLEQVILTFSQEERTKNINPFK